MGIKDLWSILTPYSERKPLHVLEGKKVAIDLACWVCESQCVVDYFVQPKMYLRNLFFRTAFMLLMGISPVFIIDGKAPELKYKMIAHRNENQQFMGARPRPEPTEASKSKKPKEAKGRTRFNFVLKQCKDLLVSMGVPCIDADGEAEALCAYLNRDGLIDGIISQDSDCFGYGALTVFRNFSISKQGKSVASGGSVEVYDLRQVWKTLDFGQNKAVALALLCGCDYLPEGVEGVGKEAVVRLFDMYSDAEILNRLRDWTVLREKLSDLEVKVDDKAFCTGCGHLGTALKHLKGGCRDCRLSTGCDSSVWKEKRLKIKAELQIRRKALKDPYFPSEEIICEFLRHPKQPESLDVDWKQPNIVKFITSLSKHLQWPEIYCFQKVFPLLTRWQLIALSRDTTTKFSRGHVVPKEIKKKRTLKGVESYEILWEDKENHFGAIFPDEEKKAYLEEHPEGIEGLWSTVEPQHLVQKAYEDLVNEFVERTKKPEKAKRKRKKANTSLQNMSDLLDALPKVPKKPQRRAKKKPEGVPPITTFFKAPEEKNLSVIEIPSDFSDCSRDESYSAVLRDIINRKPDLSHLGDKTLFYDPLVSPKSSKNAISTSTPTSKPLHTSASDSLLRKSIKNRIYDDIFDDVYIVPDENADRSFFFDRAEQPEDAFEASLNELIALD